MSETRISLRALQKKDKALILNWKEDKELRKLLGTTYPISEIEHENWFEKKSLDNQNKNLIIELDGREAIGLTGYNNLDFINRNAEIFIYIGDSKYHGQGFGRLALEEIINFSFNTLNLHMLYLNVFSYNEKAIRLYEKIGFKINGRIPHFKYSEGNYYDNIIMSILNKKE